MTGFLTRLATSWRSLWRFVVVERVGYRGESALTERDRERLDEVERRLNQVEVTLVLLGVKVELHVDAARHTL